MEVDLSTRASNALFSAINEWLSQHASEYSVSEQLSLEKLQVLLDEGFNIKINRV